MLLLHVHTASSIYQLVGEELRHNGLDIVEVSREEVGNKADTPISFYFLLVIILYQVLEGAVFLCRLLAREFVFAPVSFTFLDPSGSSSLLILSFIFLLAIQVHVHIHVYARFCFTHSHVWV